MEALVEVSEFERNRRFGLRIVSGPAPIDGHHTFTSTDGGTRIDFVAEGRLKGPMRIAQPLLRRVLNRQFKRYYAELKTVLEGAATTSAGGSLDPTR